jgi:hypothetical protein
MVIEVLVDPLQKVEFDIEFTIGIGFTVIEKFSTAPGHVVLLNVY